MTRVRQPVETCCVVDQFCTSPANWERPVPARGVCVCCGQSVCAKCSSKRLFYGKAQRVCNHCQISHLDGGDDRVVLRRTFKLAGYPVSAFHDEYRRREESRAILARFAK